MKQRQFVFAIMAMLLCFVSPAFAQNVAKVGDTEYATLSAAIGAASSGGKVTLIDNVGENVTISKNLTVDGAGKQYTGTMTINTGLTVTVEKVNFYNAGVVKADGKTGTITVKNCTFDGANKAYGYAVKTSGAGELTVENCTVKDYGYGFLYNSKSLTTHSVKNVTVENCNYGVRMGSCYTTNLENFVTKDVKYPVQIQANAARTVNMTDCSITGVKEGGKSLSCFDGSSTVTFNFKGTNKFDAALPEDANFVYNEDAADEVDNVIIVKPAVAKVGEQGYETLAAAVAAAKAGDVITFLADITDNVGGVGGDGITKELTIDGAGYTFTGEMNFKAKVTIKNVNFDGKGFEGYAVETRNGNTPVTIENCTAKNYGFGFLQMVRGTTLTVKNLTVSDVNYGLKIDRCSSKVSLENVNIDASLYAVYNSNYATKTITIKNCELNTVVTWNRGTGYKTSYVFEGENTVGEFKTVDGIDNFKLAAEAELTAPKSVNVTTVDGYKVVYVNGKYVSVDASAVAKIDDTYYATFAEAYAAAQAGETVTLLADLTMSEKIVIEKSIAIDGNGRTLTYTGSDRAITVESDANGANLTVKNLTVDCTASYCQRGINYNTAGALVLEGVTVKGANVTYALNLPGSSDGAQVTITDSNLSGNIALNVWGENSTINAENTIFTAVDNNTAEGYAAVKLNNDGTTAAEGTVINITGGEINVTGTAADDSEAVSNGTATGEVNISDTTVVNGEIGEVVAVIRYANGTSYSFSTIEEAIAKANENETVVLIRDIKASAIITIDKAITLDGNGKKLTSTAGRAINVSGADGVTIKNLTIDAKGERAINVIQNATNVTIEKVTATAANYTVNVASSAHNAVVAIKESTLNGLCTVNVSAAGANVTVDNSSVNCNDNNTTAGEAYAALCLNKDAVGGSIVATNTTVNVAEGSDSMKGRNGAENGTVTINGSTDGVAVMVAVITYEGSDYYHSFASLAKAVEFAKAGETVTMLRNATGAGVVINKSITIDFNGKTYSFTEGVGSTGTPSNGFQILKGNTVTLKNGTLNVAEDAADKFYILVQNYANLTVKDMILDGTNLDKWSKTDGDSYVLSNNCGTVAVEGSTIIANDEGDKAFAMDACLKAPYEAPVVTVSDGSTINGNVEVSATLYMNGSLTGKIVINGATGVVYGAEGLNVTTTVADHEVVYENGVYTVEHYVAQIGETKYEDLAEAFAAAQSGETVTLISDITLTNENAKRLSDVNGAEVMVTVSGNVILDMNGKKITVSEYVNTTGGKNPYLLGVFYIVDGAGLTVTGNGTIDIPQTDTQVGYVFWKRGTTGHLVIKNGTFHAGNLEDSMVYTNGSDIVTVEGGTFTLDGVESHGNGFPVIFNASGNNVRHINVTGGTYNTDITNQKWAQEVKLGEGCAIKDNGDDTWSVIKVGAYVAESADGNKVPYTSLAEAVAAAQDGNIVTLAADAEGEGIVINKSITIDFDENTYTVNEGVGSTGTPSNGFQILAGNTTSPISAVNNVVLKNGTLNVAEDAADKFYILVQNYANLTVKDMTLDGKYLDKWSKTDGDSYVLSNNSGNVVVEGETNIIANNDGDKAFAFDACDKTSWGYTLPAVKVYTTGFINGNIENSATNKLIDLYAGTYSFDVIDFCASRHATVDNYNDTWTVEALDVAVMAIVQSDYVGLVYENQNEKEVEELTYIRTLFDGKGSWVSFYVPFAVPVSAFGSDYEVAYLNNVLSYDKKDAYGNPGQDGVIDAMVMEYITIKSGTLYANTPYVIKPLTDAAAAQLTLVLTGVTLESTKTGKVIEMASSCANFKVAGTYETIKGNELLNGCTENSTVHQLYLNDWSHDGYGGTYTTFWPFEAYMIVSPKEGTPFQVDPAAFKSIGGYVAGEEYDGTTYIYDVVVENGEEVIYDLQGRRVNATEKGIYIKGGNKVLVR